MFVQPAAGNAGTALGAVLDTLAQALRTDEACAAAELFALGRHSRAAEIKQVLENCKLRFRYLLTHR